MKRLSIYSFLLFSLLYAPARSMGRRPIKKLIASSRLYSPADPIQGIFARRALKNCRSDLVKKKIKLLAYAWQLFTSTRGFAETLVHLNRQTDGVQGHIFEVEAAVASVQMGERVVALNQHIAAPDNSIKREFDIITEDSAGTKKFIECKNVSWKGSSSKKKKQFH